MVVSSLNHNTFLLPPNCIWVSLEAATVGRWYVGAVCHALSSLWHQGPSASGFLDLPSSKTSCSHRLPSDLQAQETAGTLKTSLSGQVFCHVPHLLTATWMLL